VGAGDEAVGEAPSDRYRRGVLFTRKKTELPGRESALPGRDTPIEIARPHLVLGTPLTPPFPDGFEKIVVGMGCFWGAERMFWRAPGAYTTAAGYAGGYTPNPTYQEVCSGATGHTEAVLAVFDPAVTSYDEMLRIFWEGHDPTQGMRQGNDVGTQYRSAIYWETEPQRDAALASQDRFQRELSQAGYGAITTEIAEAGPFYYAEEYHQQYLQANPNGYCGLGGTGVSCPAGASMDAPSPAA
jgi:peptide-methionine (S)-S-oxide reductase